MRRNYSPYGGVKKFIFSATRACALFVHARKRARCRENVQRPARLLPAEMIRPFRPFSIRHAYAPRRPAPTIYPARRRPAPGHVARLPSLLPATARAASTRPDNLPGAATACPWTRRPPAVPAACHGPRRVGPPRQSTRRGDGLPLDTSPACRPCCLPRPAPRRPAPTIHPARRRPAPGHAARLPPLPSATARAASPRSITSRHGHAITRTPRAAPGCDAYGVALIAQRTPHHAPPRAPQDATPSGLLLSCARPFTRPCARAGTVIGNFPLCGRFDPKTWLVF